MRAIIYVLGGNEHTDQWTERCRWWCEHRDYQLIAILTEQDADQRPSLATGFDMLHSGRADVMVVATSDYLPGDWIPRVEVAGAAREPFAIPPQNRPPGAPWQRRARPSRRPE